jgi:transposase
MEMEKYEVRVLLRHCWKQNYKAVAAAKNICDVEGEGAVNERMGQRWFKRFASGNLSLEDEQRKGRPRIMRRTKKLMNNSHQQVAQIIRHTFDLQRALFIAT